MTKRSKWWLDSQPPKWRPRWANDPAVMDHFRRRFLIGGHRAALLCSACGSQVGAVTVTADGVIVLRKRAETPIRVEANNVTVIEDDLWAHLLPGKAGSHCVHEFVIDDPAMVSSWRTKAKRSASIQLRPKTA